MIDIQSQKYSRGSEWRKWDLQVHTPGTKLNDGYKVSGSEDVWDKFCEKIEQSEVEVFGITDYFSADGYQNFIKKHQNKYPDSKKKFFLNIELKLNESVNQKLEEINIHLIFNPASLDKVSKFLSELKVVKTGKDEVPIACSELNNKEDYQSATVTRESIKKAFEETFGLKAIRQDHLLIFTAANNDGTRPERGRHRKEVITDEVDKFSDAFFGGTQNIEHFLNIKRLEDKELLISKKPVVSSSDAHSFEDLEKYLGKRVTEQGSDGIEIITRDVTWIKANPTFEGLKQILYEPEPGERVWIGPTEPYQKDDYKIIRKIKFNNTDDFPEEIEFNKDLCSIIGSRSSGKSALLAYIAHSIDKELAEELISGPGEGEKYHWDKINIEHSIEWENGQSNKDSPGRIVYIPQNYLFQKSKDPNEIKKKIEPVLFKTFPDFGVEYKRIESNIKSFNQQISEQIENWFLLSGSIESLKDKLKGLGDKKSIEKEKEKIESKIGDLKEKNQLSEEDIKKYQEISAQISIHEARIQEIDAELLQISDISEDQKYFNTLNLTLIPSLENLPKKIQEIIKKSLQGKKSEILREVNKQVVDYKDSIEKEKEETEGKSLKIEKENKELIEKYQKNIELEKFVKRLNDYNETIKKIDDTEKDKGDTQDKLKECGDTIKLAIDERKSLIRKLETNLNNVDQSALGGIKFSIEHGFDRNLEMVKQKVNMKEKTEFVEKNDLKLEYIREKPVEFLSAIYSGEQKVNVGNEKKEVAQEILTLTEKTLFVAEMEGDKIGGYSESTMTPGKRALFALRLILAESDDPWPLLIDQPEEDLDSRSICDDVVPFLKEKKKERQIIMVSHNANLVIGSDSEQIIVANRYGNEDGKQFNYLTGSIEYTKVKDENCKDILRAQGIREHTCDILDGGKIAFEKREQKYGFR